MIYYEVSIDNMEKMTSDRTTASERQRSMTGAEIAVDTLIEEGVDLVFGYPGGQVLDIYEELRKKRRKIKHILTAHEQGAAHAADGYARASGKVGVVIATSGPGAANLVTGIATAYLDSIPMVVITGNVPTGQIGRDSFQELDIADITMPITKHNYITKDINRLHEILHEAFRIARSGRMGPVLIDIPKDVQRARCKVEYIEPGRTEPIKTHPTDSELAMAADIISNAERPLVYCGGGAVNADVGELVAELARRIDAPIGCSLMGLSALANDNPDKLGLTGMHGLAYATEAVRRADVIVAVGTRFTDRATGSYGELVGNAKIVQLDIDPAEIDKNVTDAAYLVGDIKSSLERLLGILEPRRHPDWRADICRLRELSDTVTHTHDNGEPLNPYSLIDTVARYTAGMRVATDVGQHQMWVAQRYPFNLRRCFITSGGLGTMGFGMGAAIGTSLADNGSGVVLFTGDGSFGMNLNELATAVGYNIPLLIIIFNNRSLGMVKQWQSILYNHTSASELDRRTDFVKVAEAFGARGRAVHTVGELKAALTDALGKKRQLPFVIDCAISPDEVVEPVYE